jgi:hypothetical protein
MSPLAYRPADLARLSGRSVPTIYRAARAGQLTLRRIGAATVIPAASARAWMASADAAVQRATETTADTAPASAGEPRPFQSIGRTTVPF